VKPFEGGGRNQGFPRGNHAVTAGAGNANDQILTHPLRVPAAALLRSPRIAISLLFFIP
jgi:hypothetical protein